MEGLAPFRGGQGDVGSADLEAPPLAATDERVAGDAFALLDALEQKAGMAGDLQIGRKRGLEVGQNLAVDGLEGNVLTGL